MLWPDRKYKQHTLWPDSKYKHHTLWPDSKYKHHTLWPDMSLVVAGRQGRADILQFYYESQSYYGGRSFSTMRQVSTLTLSLVIYISSLQGMSISVIKSLFEFLNYVVIFLCVCFLYFSSWYVSLSHGSVVQLLIYVEPLLTPHSQPVSITDPFGKCKLLDHVQSPGRFWKESISLVSRDSVQYNDSQYTWHHSKDYQDFTFLV